MKKVNLIFGILTLFFGALGLYFMYFADGGADGLSTFVPLVFLSVLFVCCLLAFVISLFLNLQSSGSKKMLLGIIIALPVLGMLSVAGVFGYFSWEYKAQHAAQIQEHKSVLKTLQFKDENFGVAFHHVSGNVTTYENGIPIPTPITPRLENNMLIVPVDDKTYLAPDILMKIRGNPNLGLSQFLEGLKQQLQLRNTNFEEVSSEKFSKSLVNTKIWVAQNPQTSPQDRLALSTHLLPELLDTPDLIYFINPTKNPEEIWVLFVSGKILSAPATVEKMSPTNFEDGNLWFHTLEFVD
ncbi:hypothetical protein N9954_04665 [Maribacter sp.]|nr:hypothetical protein [Maribacter sp.]